MKREYVYALAAVLLLVVAVSFFASVVSNSLQPETEDTSKKPFYLGVTYCGSSVNEAYQLVDNVKNYTNLFVVQSNYLQSNLDDLVNVCNYAVDSGLNIIVYSSSYQVQQSNLENILSNAKSHWGTNFLGIYYNDEPGGKMLDAQVELCEITKCEGGGIERIDVSNDTYKSETSFSRSGEIRINTDKRLQTETDLTTISTTTIYFVNGTITHQKINSTYYYTENETKPTYQMQILTFQQDGTVQDKNGKAVTDAGNITQFTPYQQIWESRPLQTYAEAADAYTTTKKGIVDWIHNRSSVKVFTSDYALYWFDYEAGYDTVLAELGPASNPKQEIALVRGAATMHDKPWGTILTWKNSSDPSSLMNGNEMYENLKGSYESGAEYSVVFNYAPDVNGTGLLQDEHYWAIERFWNEVVQNPEVGNNVIVEDALVLPADYGWGMRSVTDTIWGLWQPDEKAPQIWNAIQNHLDNKGGKLDIIYEDSAAQANTQYPNVYYWNNTK